MNPPKPHVEFEQQLLDTMPDLRVPTVAEATYSLASAATWKLGELSLQLTHEITDSAQWIAAKALKGVDRLVYGNPQADERIEF